MNTLVAYHNDQSIKDAILLQLQAHYDADQIIKGLYWEDGKGCAVGCTVHSSNHMDYEKLFGIPSALARLEDVIFEGSPNDIAKDWPIRFMTAIQPGMDLSLVSWKFLYWLLTDVSINPGINHPRVKPAVAQAAQVILAISKGEMPDIKAARSAALAADAAKAAWAARSAMQAAAWSVAGAARLAESAAAAWSAARSASWSANSAVAEAEARSAAWSAEWSEKLARSVGNAAGWAASARPAEAAKLAAYARMAAMLIELIKAAPRANVTTQETET